MKKHKLWALVAVAALLGAGTLQAAEKKSAAGGLELSGNVDVVTGFQYDNANSLQLGYGQTTAAGALTPNVVNDADNVGVGEGQLGDLRGKGAPSHKTFNFYIDQVELDINKTFGENIRIRADLDFGRGLSGSLRTTGLGSNFLLEQGYVTANIPIGNGLEFLIGRFNTPIGLEAVDRADNIALSYTNIYRWLRPHNTTGAKIYYAFNDLFDWHVYAVNNLYDSIGSVTGAAIAPLNQTTNDTAVPSWGTRFGFTWGEKGKENVVGLSYAGGPEGIANNITVAGVNFAATSKTHFTQMADLDFSFHVTDSFIIAGEGIIRMDAANGGLGACTTSAPTNCKAFAGDLLFAYNFNETWGMYFRYEYFADRQGNYTLAYAKVANLAAGGGAVAANYQMHDFSLGTTYQITDGAKMTAEYRFDLGVPVAGGKPQNQAFALEFAYNF